jgi:hypothetical protein
MLTTAANCYLTSPPRGEFLFAFPGAFHPGRREAAGSLTPDSGTGGLSPLKQKF